MDKIVDHLFVFRGEGKIEDFPGNYSDYRAYEDSKPKEHSTQTQKVDSRVNTSTKIKLSFKEKEELEAIESNIEKLTAEKKEIETKFLEEAITGTEINELSVELQKINTLIDKNEERWFKLSAKIDD